MGQQRYTPTPLKDLPAQPFHNSEEAWLWFAQCQIARRDGALRGGRGEVARPCDPDDVYRAVMALHRRRVIGQNHLAVLGRFGLRQEPPDPRLDTASEVALWAEALDRLTTVLRAKGIVADAEPPVMESRA